MPDYTVNQDAVRHAKRLIDAREYVLPSRWAGLLPNARITIYADSAHGFLFQHHEQFAADVHAFLDETE